MLKRIVPFAVIVVIAIGILMAREMYAPEKSAQYPDITATPAQLIPTPTSVPLIPVPSAKFLDNNYHVYQSFNNCGPAALSMALSYYGINVSQEELGEDLRPYQIAQGDNDDKSVTLGEMARKSEEFGLLVFHRPNGTMDLIKKFITHGMPVITRTWLVPDDDIGHYRVIKGYDDSAGTVLQDDSLQGKNLTYSYEVFNTLWSKFNFEYLVLVPADKKEIAVAILGEDGDETKSWEKAARNARAALMTNENDIYTRFNLSVALYHSGDFAGSVREYEAVQDRLPFRTLWYQIEPIQAYYELGNYDRVFQLTGSILNNANRAFSELYMIRGDSYKRLGDTEKARVEYENAVYYNRNLEAAQEALSSLN